MTINIISISLVSCLLYTCLAAETDSDPEINNVLESLDRIFDQSYQWWAKIYKPSNGGFYYSLSAKKSKRFTPIIEGTSKAIRVMKWTGCLNQAPESFKQKCIHFFQQRQDPETGFFRDPMNKDRYSHNALTRALGMAVNSLEYLGAKPLHPLPLEQETEDSRAHYQFINSDEALRIWLDALPWERRTWTVGGNLRAQAGLFETMEEPKRSRLLKIIHDYCCARQLDNGFFGKADDHWTSSLSGSYKIASFFEINKLSIPHTDKMLVSTLAHLFNSDYTSSTVLYNTANMLGIIHRNSDGIDLTTRLRIVKQCIIIMKRVQHDDGGFLKNKNNPVNKQQGMPVAEAVLEGNTDSTGLMFKTRSILITLLTGKEGPHPHARSGDLINALAE